jgi:conjugative relaxase-like TrwC/TraI family protein
MITISKPITASQAQTYHREEFSNGRQNYYTEGDQIRGEWHGRMATQWGLTGEVAEEHFARLAEGQHPVSGEQLVRHQTPREYANVQGETIRTLEHRAGWDATFSAPKSVSLTALVGGDERVRAAHRESVAVTLDEMERYVQARIGGNHPAETTGKWVAAKFEHDSSRPVDGYAAPQLHTHVVFFNMTEAKDGEMRALQPHELYRTQQYATAIYRSELALRLQQLGYQIEQGKSGQPEIKGYSQEYLEASSPRRQQIKEHLENAGLSGAGAAQIAAHQTRESKLPSDSHESMQQRHRAMAKSFGNQPDHVTRTAREHHVEAANPDHKQRSIDSAITYSRERNLEREAVADERDLMRDALKRSLGEVSLSEVRPRFEQAVGNRELIEIESRGPGRTFTTGEMIHSERDTIALMRDGQNQHGALASFETRREIEAAHAHLSNCQRAAVEQVLSSRDQITGLEGVAGAGKTTSLTTVREAAKREGYEVRGLAPTSRATHQLQEAGIESTTLQRHLVTNEQEPASQKRLYILDESSLASTKQVNQFLHGLREQDRVLMVGDVRQHEAVEAGRPYQQLQDAGMQTARLDEIVRQKDPALKEAVEQLARGEVKEAIGNLDHQGRVHEIGDRQQRIEEIARQYAVRPESTLVISPDNQSRTEINERIHRAMQSTGRVSNEEHEARVLTARQELTGADRQWAVQYESGDVVRYGRGSKTLGVEAGEYARVSSVNREQNEIKVERSDGEQQSYNPRRLSGVTVYREEQRAFSEGDRVQFTAPSKELHVANRQLGTVEKINQSGDIRIRTDVGRRVEFNVNKWPHVDHGYAVTSHSSQGQTADRVLIHVDTEQGYGKLINSRLAYVSVSRGRYDAQIYTNDRAHLAPELSRDVSHHTAAQPSREHGPSQAQSNDPSSAPRETYEHAQAQGQSVSR